MLIGVLRKSLSEMLAAIPDTVTWLQTRTGQRSADAAMSAASVVGFVVCAPSGAELSQDEIHDGLAAVLELGHPTAIYQLPQVTQNEVSPASVARLAARYSHLYMMKDTSGTDRVALADADLSGLFLVRGAEGQYATWLKTGGGRYDGLLLSSANCLAAELAAMMHALETGGRGQADHMADKLQQIVGRCFEIVSDYPAANPFTNANKILDQIMAYGHDAAQQPPPYLHGGHQLPSSFIAQAYQLALKCDLVPSRGYMA